MSAVGGHRASTARPLGTPGKYTFCFAEAEHPDWEPLQVQRGFARDASTVTLFAGEGVQGVVLGWYLEVYAQNDAYAEMLILNSSTPDSAVAAIATPGGGTLGEAREAPAVEQGRLPQAQALAGRVGEVSEPVHARGHHGGDARHNNSQRHPAIKARPPHPFRHEKTSQEKHNNRVGKRLKDRGVGRNPGDYGYNRNQECTGCQWN